MRLKEYKKNLKKEYENTFKKTYPKRVFQFKLRYAVLLAFGIVFAALFIEHFYVYSYNEGVKRHNEAIANRTVDIEHSADLSMIQTKSDYEKIVSTYRSMTAYHTEKTSVLSYLFTFQFLGCSNKATDDMAVPEAPTDTNQGSYQTNVQVKGIDEADVAKCDGTYIYYLYSETLYIYEIATEKNIIRIEDSGFELFIYKNTVVSLGMSKITIYTFEKNKLTIKCSLNYDKYLTSRLLDHKLYFVYRSYALEESIQYEDCYYDACSNPNFLYSIYCYDLETTESKEVQLLAANNTILYASNQAFYFASAENNYTSISIFSLNLDAVGVVRVCGKILNQFSMDEYEGYLRVVATDTNRNAEELNAITIFELTEELKRVGYLDQGIGKERQTVKSVRFDKNTCFVVTYEDKDPLYEIDCSDPTKPSIVSAYEAPGYSNYLHTFILGEKEYVLGLGYTDSLRSTKISVYAKEEGTSQIGKDFVLATSEYYSKGNYYNEMLILSMFENHKALFLYGDNTHLYLGAQVARNAYLIFKIDVESKDVITIHKEIKLLEDTKNSSRAFLVGDSLYLTDCDKIHIIEFNK